jgi:hypothetical protein
MSNVVWGQMLKVDVESTSTNGPPLTLTSTSTYWSFWATNCPSSSGGSAPARAAPGPLKASRSASEATPPQSAHHQRILTVPPSECARRTYPYLAGDSIGAAHRSVTIDRRHQQRGTGGEPRLGLAAKRYSITQ